RRHCRLSRAILPTFTSSNQLCVAPSGRGTLSRPASPLPEQRYAFSNRKWPCHSHGRFCRAQARSDQVLLDLLAGVLLALEPARHPPAARPRLVCLRVSVLCFHSALPTIRTQLTIAHTRRTSASLRSVIPERCELFLEFCPFHRSCFVVRLLYVLERISLLVEGESSEPSDDRANSALPCHFASPFRR